MNRQELEAQIQKILTRVMKKNVSHDWLLISSGRIDSVMLIDVIIALEEAFSITIEPLEINAATFDSISLISTYVEKKCQATGTHQ